jgi:hypothetical protein
MSNKAAWTYLSEHPLLKERFELDLRYWPTAIDVK